jgi:hypothetical protein
MDIYEMYGALAIPYKYGDAVDELWESWEKERDANPPSDEGSFYIPSEFPDID